MMARSIATVALVVLLGVGCGAEESGRFASAADALDGARRRWSEAAIGSYRLEVAETRNYWTRGCTWVSTVSDGSVISVAVMETEERAASGDRTCSEVGWTVEILHDIVDRWLRDLDQFSDPQFGVDTLEVDYSDLGVPRSMTFDLANGADEEAEMRLTFTPGP